MALATASSYASWETKAPPGSHTRTASSATSACGAVWSIHSAEEMPARAAVDTGVRLRWRVLTASFRAFFRARSVNSESPPKKPSPHRRTKKAASPTIDMNVRSRRVTMEARVNMEAEQADRTPRRGLLDALRVLLAQPLAPLSPGRPRFLSY